MESKPYGGPEVLIECPRCKKKYPRHLCQVVNSAEMPEATDAILQGTFFDFHCPHCGREEDSFLPMAYLDPVNKYLFYLEGQEEDKLCSILLDGQIKEQGDIGPLSEYRIREVHLPADLAEKIRLGYLGLDDRIIELCKLPIVHSFHQKFPDKKLYRIALIDKVFYQEFLICPYNSESLYHAEFSRELYDDLERRFSAFLPPDRGEKICIDQAWAMSLFQPQGIQQ